MFSIIFGFLKLHRLLFIALAVASVLGTITLYVWGAERAKGQVAVLEDRLGRIEQAARANAQAFAECELVNAANQREAMLQADRARNAEMRLAAAEANANRDVGDITREAETFRSRDLDCPALDDDFRAWVLN